MLYACNGLIMEINFNISSVTEIPRDVKDLKDNYYLKKVKSVLGKEEEWLLQKKTDPISAFVGDILMSLSNFFNKTPTYLHSDKLAVVMKMAANPTEKYLNKEHLDILQDPELESLSRMQDFQTLSRLIYKMEKSKTKLKRALRKLASIGKGISELKREGLKGKTLILDYFIEVATRDHVYPVDRLLHQWRESKTHLNFDDWMQWRSIEMEQKKRKWMHLNDSKCSIIEEATLKKVNYLSTVEERKPYQLEFKEGLIWQNQSPYDTSSEETIFSGKGWAIFVIDPKRQFYAGTHEIGRFHHSSFLGGSAILGAGEMQTDANGRLIALSNKSGHYQPSREQLLNTLLTLKQANIDLSQVKLIEYTREGRLIFESAQQFLDSYGSPNHVKEIQHTYDEFVSNDQRSDYQAFEDNE